MCVVYNKMLVKHDELIDEIYYQQRLCLNTTLNRCASTQWPVRIYLSDR